MDLIAGIKPEALKALCDSYDKVCGMYPESYYEGAALFEYYCKIIEKGKDIKELTK